MKKYKVITGVFAVVGVVALGATAAYADSIDIELEQIINTGTLHNDLVATDGVTPATRGLDFNPVTAFGSTQDTSATYPAGTDKVLISNPGAADGGWNLSVQAKDGVSAKWVSGSDEFDFDDPAGSGYTNGQLTVNASGATVSVAAPNTLTGVTPNPTATAFNSNNTINLVSAAAGSQDIWLGYLTGVQFAQKIPAGQAAGTYNITLTQTLASI